MLTTFETAQQIAKEYGFTLTKSYGQNVDGTPHENWKTEFGVHLYPGQTVPQMHQTMQTSVRFQTEFNPNFNANKI